ncbi:MAG: amidohydrolase family protein [Desulfobacteraceae bacterium]|nr:amidohydrolase family protein [Desulfobacteraceae bacterium]
MIIDIHTHIFPTKIRSRRQTYFTNEPAFELLYRSSKSKLAGADELVAIMDEQGVDRAVTFGFPWQTSDWFKYHNDYILESVNRYPDRLIGFCCFDPLHPEGAKEAYRCLNAGLSGIGELAFYCSVINETCFNSLEPVMEIARQFNCPVMIHTNEPVGHLYPGKTDNTLAQIYSLLKKFPKNRIILAHWGAGLFFYNLLKKQVRETLANTWFDTAASPYLYQNEIYLNAMRLAGDDKILWGSDYPLIQPRRYFDEIGKSGITKEQILRICGRNAAQLLNLHL